jgi:hypothetical protein
LSKFPFIEIYELETKARASLFRAYVELVDILESLTGYPAPKDHVARIKWLVKATGAGREAADWKSLEAKIGKVVKLLRNAQPNVERLAEIEGLEPLESPEIRGFPTGTYEVRQRIPHAITQKLIQITRQRGRPPHRELIKLVRSETRPTAAKLCKKHSKELKTLFRKKNPTELRRTVQHAIEYCRANPTS